MKKMFFFAALAAVMASCTSEEPMMVSNGNGTAIGFDTYVGKATRAGDINTANLTKFYVYGGKTAVDFNGTEVTKTDAGWTYSPTKYWESGAKYTFAAVAPTKTGSFDNSKLTVADYTPGDDDLIVAVTNEITGKEVGSNAAVNLNFKHALAKVQVTFSGDLDKLSDVKLTGVNNKATLSVSYGEEGTAPVWDEANSTGDYAYTIDGTSGKGVRYVLPQTLAETTTISFTYNGKAYSKGLDNESVPAWEIGKAYNYSITLKDEDGITFDVSVTEWPTIGDEPETPTEPETPEEPADNPTQTTVPENLTLTSVAATWIRSSNTSFSGATQDAMEIKKSGEIVFPGLLQFDLPANLKHNGYKLKAQLRLVSTQAKGDRYIDLHEYTGTDFSESATYETIGTQLEADLQREAIANFRAEGHGTKAIGDSGLSGNYLEASGWQNFIDFTDFINTKVSTADNGSSLVLIITKTNENNDSWKFGTHRYAGKTVESNATDSDGKKITFNGDDLVPQLIITYEKE